MTPWLRLTLRLVRLLLVLVTATPVSGVALAYGAEATPPDASAPPGRSLVSVSPAAHASGRAASASAAEPSRAGSRAGEGRMRPGRPDGPAAEEEGDDDPSRITGSPGLAEPQDGYPEEAEPPGVTPAASDTPEEAGLDPGRQPLTPTSQDPVPQAGAPAEPALRILPLGSGLVLIGLGLGLAFLGLRVRRS
ncbi:hypothetical protein [Streptomyces sp. IBSBF 3136]|uniref:hypothetical protein n=1 Tax=Streptomyces sp. IBSBF 3136 TaxID=2903524 RepID=UPI002FDBCD64